MPSSISASSTAVAVRQTAVAADVSVLAAHDDVDGVALADVADAPHGRGVDPRQATLSELMGAAVAEPHLDPAAVDEVELLLLVVVVAAGLPPGREDDRVHAERGHPELSADLLEAVIAAERVKRADRVALALGYLVFTHAENRNRLPP
jgi:hypothetical protein